MNPNGQFEPFFNYSRYPELTGRPNRIDPINIDDIMNLQIALALAKDVLDFVEDHHIFKA